MKLLLHSFFVVALLSPSFTQAQSQADKTGSGTPASKDAVIESQGSGLTPEHAVIAAGAALAIAVAIGMASDGDGAGVSSSTITAIIDDVVDDDSTDDSGTVSTIASSIFGTSSTTGSSGTTGTSGTTNTN